MFPRNTRVPIGSVLLCAPLGLTHLGCVTIGTPFASPPAGPMIIRGCNGDHGYGPNPSVTLGEPRPLESTPSLESNRPAPSPVVSPPSPSPTPAEAVDPAFPPALAVPDLSPPTRQSWKPGRSS